MLNVTEQELKQFAEQQAETIVIRSYNDGNSKDERRNTTKPEKEIIKTIIYGGLLAIRQERESQSVIDTCEYIGILQIPQMNGYDTIYIPMQEWCNNNIKE